jgi:hypothetical protein
MLKVTLRAKIAPDLYLLLPPLGHYVCDGRCGAAQAGEALRAGR